MAIDPKELRLGNYFYSVYAPYGHDISSAVAQIKSGSDIDSELPSFRREGIPITEQWLKDFGFEKAKFGEDTCWVIKYERVGEGEKTQNFFLYRKYGQPEHEYTACIESTVNNVRIGLNFYSYIHSLQNVFCAITGHELKLQNDK